MTATITFDRVRMSKAGKMPCQSYSLPAQMCITGSKLREVKGSTCSKCYAMKGNYRFPNVKEPRQYNYEHVIACEHDADLRQAWVEMLATAVANDRFFRWHDSGDLQGMFHLEMIVAVAEAAPWCQFWIPTREHGIVNDYLLEHGSFPSNLVVRLSVHMQNQTMTINQAMQAAGVTISTVAYDGGTQCKAYTNKGKCGTCRACWDRNIASVNYPLH